MYSEIVGPFVRWVATASGALLLCLVAGSCAVVDGLDGFSPVSCGGDCDATADHPAVSQSVKDAVPETTATDSDDASAETDSALEGDDPGGDAASEAESQSVPDAELDTGVPVADGGCGLGTTSSCSACGVACDTSTGAPACKGSTCSYTCNAGRQDCNASKAPDTDGCECAGTACCSGKCQTAHSNGKGNSFYDCSAAGTHNQGQAAEACASLAGSSACRSSTAPCNCLLIICGSQAQSVCGSSGGKCYCWQYAGPNAGTVQESSGSNCAASCGASSDSAWN